MKSSMPECNYVVSAIENAEQSQDNMEEEMALMQETFEIIEESKPQMEGNDGDDQTMTVTGDTATTTDTTSES